MRQLWRRLMTFLGFRTVRPPELVPPTVMHSEELDEEFACAVQKHKEVSRRVIEKSFDNVDRAEQARLSLKAIFDRSSIPGIATAEGAWELLKGERRNGNHH